jgi:HlyD family secretion protein
MRKTTAAVLATLLLGAGILGFRRGTIPRLLRLSGAASAARDELVVAPAGLNFTVEATGVLRATSVQNFGPPPQFNNVWEFQLISMLPEGNNVRAGDVLITFDSQKIRQDLDRFKNELDQARKELEKTRAQIDLEQQELRARLADAENRFEKFQLKNRVVTAAIDSSRNVELDRLALEQVRREVEALKERLDWHRRSSEATYNIIASKKTRAESKVGEIEKGIERFSVKADRAGVVIYKLKWNGNRFQIGENVWSGLSLLEIPDLSTIIAEVFVPEVDLGKVRPGQRAEVAIDALPGRSWPGKVTSVGTLVRSKSWDIPNKILDVQVALDHVDTTALRPGMSLKGKIEIGALQGVLAVPVKAVRTTAEGSWVKVRTGAGWTQQKVKLGESDGVRVAVVDGLTAGARIAADFGKAL